MTDARECSYFVLIESIPEVYLEWRTDRRAWSGRADEGSFPYWVALIEEKCTGANYEIQQAFCRAHRLSLSRFGHAVVWQKEWYQVFRFGKLADADMFMSEFGGERMHPSEKGKGKNWAQWRKGSYKP